MQTGLYIVGTPIGNLSDMSPRAIETLRAADLIAAEDTRVFGKLAAHFDIKTKVVAFHDHNERDMAETIADKIAAGASVALVSDSGMPLISDPGFRLVRLCRERGLPVFVVPGPTAAISALALTGFPTDRFTFCGFFRDEKHLRSDNKIRHTIIYYESPNRVNDTIAMMARVMPERKVAIVREITKIHEETVIGYPAELMGREWRGEIVIVVAPAPDEKMSDADIADVVNEVVANSTKGAARDVSARTGISKKEAYKKLLETKK